MPKPDIAKMANPCPVTIPDPHGNGIVLRDMAVGDGTERQCCACNPGQRLETICEAGDVTSTQCGVCPAGGNADMYAHQNRTCSFESMSTQPFTTPSLSSTFHRTGTTSQTTTIQQTIGTDPGEASDTTVIDQFNTGNPIETWMVAVPLLGFVALVIVALIWYKCCRRKGRCKRRRRTRTPSGNVEDPPAAGQPYRAVRTTTDDFEQPLVDRRSEPTQQTPDSNTNGSVQLLVEHETPQHRCSNHPSSHPNSAQMTKILDEAGIFFINIGKHPSIHFTCKEVHALAVNFLVGPTRLSDLDKEHRNNTARYLYEVFQVLREDEQTTLLDDIFKYLQDDHLLVAQELDLALLTKVPGYQARYPVNTVGENARQR